jgi:hypothetical protein
MAPGSKSTIDKPKFEIAGHGLGAVDININHLGNRLAVSTIDYELSIYNIHPESGLTHYKDLSKSFENGIIDVGKINFSPSGNEILGGTTSLKVFDITSGNVIREFN